MLDCSVKYKKIEIFSSPLYIFTVKLDIIKALDIFCWLHEIRVAYASHCKNPSSFSSSCTTIQDRLMMVNYIGCMYMHIKMCQQRNIVKIFKKNIFYFKKGIAVRFVYFSIIDLNITLYCFHIG